MAKHLTRYVYEKIVGKVLILSLASMTVACAGEHEVNDRSQLANSGDYQFRKESGDTATSMNQKAKNVAALSPASSRAPSSPSEENKSLRDTKKGENSQVSEPRGTLVLCDSDDNRHPEDTYRDGKVKAASKLFLVANWRHFEDAAQNIPNSTIVKIPHDKRAFELVLRRVEETVKQRGCKFEKIVVLDHGSYPNQAKQSYQQFGESYILPKDVSEFAKIIQAAVEPGAETTMYGCWVGNNPQMMQRIADQSQTKVSASTKPVAYTFCSIFEGPWADLDSKVEPKMVEPEIVADNP